VSDTLIFKDPLFFKVSRFVLAEFSTYKAFVADVAPAPTICNLAVGSVAPPIPIFLVVRFIKNSL
jgi:hypothetical protein